MTKVGKTLIAALVVADLGFVFYIMSPQGDHSAGKSDAASDGSVKMMAPLYTGKGSDPQVAAGTVASDMPGSSTLPSATSTGSIDAAPPRPVAVPNVLAQAPAAAAAASAAKEQKTVTVRPQPVRTVDVANNPKPVSTNTSRSARGDRTGDDGRSSAGSNPVAAAMTEALVRQSAQLDPSLPPPDMSKSVSMHDVSDTASRGGSNPVAAAMTEQLVRESSRINSPAHTPGQPGAQ
ncbi:hypothetical protein [Paraburkholderia solisilvae]|uniref:Extensin n=1 Tax=Paraburkholderia solisilvae TaxID=624376 RepID=A0A6J5EP70_9BURK|nr:hypothetical protein [Paraburkholderia solisilvae]CAB3768358.1 hypothetical protein LMG29739_05295 [Paraburkholderia solisilvae]